VIEGICRFYGAKGQKRRQEDLCSKIRKFIFESKLSLVVVGYEKDVGEEEAGD
jgi:hypothetical protein